MCLVLRYRSCKLLVTVHYGMLIVCGVSSNYIINVNFVKKNSYKLCDSLMLRSRPSDHEVHGRLAVVQTSEGDGPGV